MIRMYFWTGISVNEQLLPLREIIARAEAQLSFALSNLSLPLHTTLKMPFWAEDALTDAICLALQSYFIKLQPFELPVQGPEHFDQIAWLRLKENPKLNQVQDELLDLLGTAFGIESHEYDRDRKFHVTLFMDEDREKIAEAFRSVEKVAFPAFLRADRFIIAASPSGDFGSYQILKEIRKK